MQVETSASKQTRPRTTAGLLARNSAANLARVGVTSLIAILLPAYLTHHLPVQIYGAWVLILQLGAYVAYLDFGVQTAVSKYIAEYAARNDAAGCNRCASAGLAIMLAASVSGAVLTLVLAWSVPHLFAKMPVALYRDARIGIVLVGISLSVNLSTSIFSAIFLGLQRFQIPMATTVTGKVLYGIALCASVYFHSSLAVMGAAVALANLFSSVLQVIAWKKLASHVLVTLHDLDRVMLKRMFDYCVIMTIWSVCMLFISGIDLTIVGHYAFDQVAYYSVATAPTNFILMLIGALLGPLLPATSALSTERSASQLGAILLRTTRYASIILLASGLPLMVGGYLILRAWVGSDYALQSVQFLRILLLANIVRHLCAPYAIMVVATAKQRVATASAVTEAMVNLVASVWLARNYGAMGVAAGTLIGSAAGVGMHFGVSMHYTRNISTSRLTLFLKGVLRPATMAIPSLLLLPHWWLAGPPLISLQVWLVWGFSTALLAWLVSMNREDRDLFFRITTRNPKADPGGRFV